MFTVAEEALLNNPGDFSMIRAASAAWGRCGTCPEKQRKVRSLLRIAALKYMDDRKFHDHCKTMFPLPCLIGGILVR